MRLIRYSPANYTKLSGIKSLKSENTNSQCCTLTLSRVNYCESILPTCKRALRYVYLSINTYVNKDLPPPMGLTCSQPTGG